MAVAGAVAWISSSCPGGCRGSLGEAVPVLGILSSYRCGCHGFLVVIVEGVVDYRHLLSLVPGVLAVAVAGVVNLWQWPSRVFWIFGIDSRDIHGILAVAVTGVMDL